MARPTVVLIHGGKTTAARLREAMPDAEVVVIYREGLSGAYDEKTGLAHDYPTLQALLGTFAPSWSGGPLVILAFSAGAWALRYYLRDAGARSAIDAAIFLDGLYGASGSSCNLAPYDGVLAFAAEAAASPSRHRLVMTYSQAHPAPGICSKAIAAEAGSDGMGPGIFVVGASNADHGAQQSVVGPAVVKQLVAPWLRTGIGTFGKVLLVAAAGAAAWVITMRFA